MCKIIEMECSREPCAGGGGADGLQTERVSRRIGIFPFNGCVCLDIDIGNITRLIAYVVRTLWQDYVSQWMLGCYTITVLMHECCSAVAHPITWPTFSFAPHSHVDTYFILHGSL